MSARNPRNRDIPIYDPVCNIFSDINIMIAPTNDSVKPYNADTCDSSGSEPRREKKYDSARFTAPPKKNPIKNASAWTITYISSVFARPKIAEKRNIITTNAPVIHKNQTSLFSESFTERIFPRIAPIDEKISNNEDAEFDLSKNSLE